MANNTPSSSQSQLIFTIGLKFGGHVTKDANKELTDFIISQGIDEAYIHQRHRPLKALIVHSLLKSIFTSGGYVKDKDITYNILDIYVNNTYSELTDLGTTIFDKLKRFLQNKTQYKLSVAEAAPGKINKKQKMNYDSLLQVNESLSTHRDASLLLQLNVSPPDPTQVPSLPSSREDFVYESLPDPTQVPVSPSSIASQHVETRSLRMNASPALPLLIDVDKFDTMNHNFVDMIHKRFSPSFEFPPLEHRQKIVLKIFKDEAMKDENRLLGIPLEAEFNFDVFLEKVLIVRKGSVDRLKGDSTNPAENFVSNEIIDFYVAILKGYVI